MNYILKVGHTLAFEALYIFEVPAESYQHGTDVEKTLHKRWKNFLTLNQPVVNDIWA